MPLVVMTGLGGFLVRLDAGPLGVRQDAAADFTVKKAKYFTGAGEWSPSR